MPFFKILSLCAEAYLQPSQTSKNFNLVKRVEKKNNGIIWNFSFRAEHFSPWAEFPSLFSVPISEAAIRRCSRKEMFLKILQISQKNTCVRV